MRSVQRSMCAAMLTLQAVVLGLTTPVLISVASVSVATALWVGLGLTVACVVAAGMLRRRWAYGLGWLVQVASVALGFVIPMMFVLGVIFGALWAGAYFLGAKIDREKAERAVLEQQWAAEHGGADA
jgi:ABC-type nitrate/sulfonate/bicarbonate transport system permease component